MSTLEFCKPLDHLNPLAQTSYLFISNLAHMARSVASDTYKQLQTSITLNAAVKSYYDKHNSAA